jgi:hypothetical protein
VNIHQNDGKDRTKEREKKMKRRNRERADKQWEAERKKLRDAIRKGDAEGVKKYIQYSDILCGFQRNAYIKAAERGYLQIFQIDQNWETACVPIAIELARDDKYESLNRLIEVASQHGHTELVDLFLSAPQWSEIVRGYPNALQSACRAGRLTIVEKFLDVRYKHMCAPVMDEAMYFAATRGHLPVVERLRQESVYSLKQLVEAAARCGHMTLLETLLQDPRTVVADLEDALGCAADLGRLTAVERLLLDPRVDPSRACSIRNGFHHQFMMTPIDAAVRMGRLAVAGRLLEDPRGLPPSRNALCYAMNSAYTSNVVCVEELLLKDERVYQVVRLDGDFMGMIFEKGGFKTIKKIIDDIWPLTSKEASDVRVKCADAIVLTSDLNRRDALLAYVTQCYDYRVILKAVRCKHPSDLALQRHVKMTFIKIMPLLLGWGEFSKLSRDVLVLIREFIGGPKLKNVAAFLNSSDGVPFRPRPLKNSLFYDDWFQI